MKFCVDKTNFTEDQEIIFDFLFFVVIPHELYFIEKINSVKYSFKRKSMNILEPNSYVAKVEHTSFCKLPHTVAKFLVSQRL
jgi:hypothetical protein